MAEIEKGSLIIIGGAEDKTGECQILKYSISKIGGNSANLLVLTTATENPEEVGSKYRQVFSNLGLTNINVVNIDTREEANNEENIQKLNSCNGLFFTGGDQLRITSILGGTRFYYALKSRFEEGLIIIGTSAGASVMSNTMIVDGMDNASARKCTLKMAPGLGLWEEVLIDQHFAQRGRIGRLLCGVSENPHILGLGIDEDTAIVVSSNGNFEVIGTNAVTVVDGKSIKSSNVSELKPNELLAISNVTLHVLTKGYGFNVANREVLRLN